MKLTSVSGTYAPTIADGTNNTENFTTWHTIPTEYTKVAYRTSTTDADNNGQGAGSSLTTTYDAYVSATQPAGTYVGQVKYTLVHPSTAAAPIAPLNASDCPANSICYATNASDVLGTMISAGDTAPTLTTISSNYPTAAKQTQTKHETDWPVDITSNSTAQLIAPNYARPGYGFAGWSTDFNATSASTIYGPNETITTGDLSINGMILYPVWIVSTGNLQGWSGCSSLTTAPSDGTRATLTSMTALTDTRDNNVYTVARLADGKCWMTENLRLNSENSIGAENIAKAQGYGDATSSAQGNLGKFIGLAISEDANFTDGTTANSLYSINGGNSTININGISSYKPGYRMPRYNKNNTNMALNATNSDNTTTLADSYNGSGNNVRWYAYGNYYTWSAAIADTAYYSQNNISVTTTSICPTGWYLPQGGLAYEEGDTGGVNVTGDTSTYRDFYNLGYALVGTTAYENTPDDGDAYYNGSNYSNLFRTFPNNFVYSGRFYSASAVGRGTSSSYWSSSVSSRYYAYNAQLQQQYVRPGTDAYYKYYGYSVRCIAAQ